MKNIGIFLIGAIAPLLLSGSMGQDSASTDGLEKKKQELDSRAAKALREHADKFSAAEDFEGAAVLFSVAYFLEHQDDIIAGRWKLPKKGEDSGWDRVDAAYEALRAGAASKPASKALEELDVLAGYSQAEDRAAGGGSVIELKDWNGFNVTIRDDGAAITIEYQPRGQQAADKEATLKLLESIKKMFSNRRIQKALEAEIEKIKAGTKSTPSGDNPEKNPGADSKDSLSAMYLTLSAEAQRLKLPEQALRCEVLAYQIRHLSDAIDALRTLNGYRRSANLKPVGYAALLSYGCALHARYLAMEDPARTFGLAAHDESKDSPFYTDMGATAGKKSLVSPGRLVSAVHSCIASLYHRVPLINPHLEKVGMGRWKAARSNKVAIDADTGVAATQSAEIVSFPASGQTAVPLRFAPLQEFPDPLPPDAETAGFPITLTLFPLSSTAQIKGKQATLMIDGKEVPCWISWPGSPANRSQSDNANSFCLIPKSALQPKSEYVVRIKATVNGKEGTWEWRFRTSDR